MNQLRNPPAAVIALRELITQWRQRAEDLRGNERVNTEDVETEATLHQCADALDALAARVEPPPQEQDCGLTANDIYHVMQAWEQQPASDEQTRIVIALGKLRG